MAHLGWHHPVVMHPRVMSCCCDTRSVDGEWRTVFVVDAVGPDEQARAFRQSEIDERRLTPKGHERNMGIRRTARQKGIAMKRRLVATLAAGTLMMLPATYAAAQPDHEPFVVETLVVSAEVIPGTTLHETPNGKWVFFEDKYVPAQGDASIGSTEYASASLEATLWGKLSPDGTKGLEWGTFELTLNPGDLSCEGAFMVKRYEAAAGPVPYGEAGKFRAECDDGTKVKGDLVGEFGVLGSTPGFLVTMDGMAR